MDKNQIPIALKDESNVDVSSNVHRLSVVETFKGGELVLVLLDEIGEPAIFDVTRIAIKAISHVCALKACHVEHCPGSCGRLQMPR